MTLPASSHLSSSSLTKHTHTTRPGERTGTGTGTGTGTVHVRAEDEHIGVEIDMVSERKGKESNAKGTVDLA